jgi:hypothetical protein
VLDDPGFSTADGAHMQQFQLNGGLNQQWRFVPLDDGTFEVMNASSGKILDIPSFSTSKGALVNQFHWTGGLNQRWKFFQA